MARLFGTDGVRGVANSELTNTMAYMLGQAGAHVLTTGVHKPSILVGADTRISGDMLKCALMAGICSVGAHAVDLGVITTPAIALLTRHFQADAGVIISASHNPAKYNGIKFFDKDGHKLSDALEDRIEAIVRRGSEQLPMPEGADLGRLTHDPQAQRSYIDILKGIDPCDLSGLTIALDCANGAASAIAPVLFAELGARVIPLFAQPDGMNINDGCGSTHPEALQRQVQELGADVGLAFDGDADRLIAVDELGRQVDGDQTLVICADYLKSKGQLPKDTVVATVMSNMGLDIAMRQRGIAVVRTSVGDRYILERMLADGYVLGGEQSGHIIFLNHNSTGDGIMTAMHLLKIMRDTGRPMSQLADQMQALPQVLVNVKVAQDKKQAYARDVAIQREIERIERKLDGEGRVLVRPSGTEALVRIMLEGRDSDEITRDANALAQLMQERLA